MKMPNSQCRVLLTTDGGLEKVASEEFSKKSFIHNLAPIHPEIKPFGLRGQLLVETSCSLDTLWPVFHELHAVHHIILLLAGFPISKNQPLATISSKLKTIPIEELECSQTFRVTTKRTGKHAFTSMDVEKTAGAIIANQYNKKVSLENFDLNIRIDVMDNYCVTGIQLTNEALSHRYSRSYLPRVSIKPTVAYALSHLADVKNLNGNILDPFCGAGTILFEVIKEAPHLNIFGCDINEKAVEGTLQNAWEANMAGKFHLRKGDTRNLREVYPALKFNAILANPPYGLKLGRKRNFKQFYIDILKEFHHALTPDGKLVIMVWKYKTFEKTLEETSVFRVLDVVSVARAGITLYIYVLQRISSGHHL